MQCARHRHSQSLVRTLESEVQELRRSNSSKDEAIHQLEDKVRHARHTLAEAGQAVQVWRAECDLANATMCTLSTRNSVSTLQHLVRRLCARAYCRLYGRDAKDSLSLQATHSQLQNLSRASSTQLANVRAHAQKSINEMTRACTATLAEARTQIAEARMLGCISRSELLVQGELCKSCQYLRFSLETSRMKIDVCFQHTVLACHKRLNLCWSKG